MSSDISSETLLLERALAAARAKGDPVAAARAAIDLAGLLLILGRPGPARAMAWEAGEAARSAAAGGEDLRAGVQRIEGLLALAAGRGEDAARLLTDALLGFVLSHRAVEASRVHLDLAAIHREAGRLAEAAREIAHVQSSKDQVPPDLAARLALEDGLVRAASGDRAGALAALAAARGAVDAVEGLMAWEVRWRALVAESRLSPPPASAAAAHEIRSLLDALPAGLREDVASRPEVAAVLTSAPRAPIAPAVQADERARELAALARTLAADALPRRLLGRLMDGAIRLSGAERGFVVTIATGADDPLGAQPPAAGGPFDVRVARNYDREDLDGADGKVSRSIVRRVLASGEPVIVPDARIDQALSRLDSVGRLGLVSVACLPITAADRTVGALYLDNRFVPGAFKVADREVLMALADHASIAWQKSCLISEILERRRAERRARRLAEEGLQTLARRLSDADAALAEARARLRSEREGFRLAHDFSRMVGTSKAIQDLLGVLDRLAESEVPVLVTGETGTGKDLAARCLHAAGRRKAGPFVTVACATLPEGLIEPELFGCMKGAFTGATEDRPGLLRSANGGTLYLDRVDEMSPLAQAKILRVLEEGAVRPVGAGRAERIDVRVISSARADLKDAVRAGRFRDDLYWRLAVFPVRVPPLRDRGGDAAALLTHFLSEALGRPIPVSPEAAAALAGRPWPGNIREVAHLGARLAARQPAEVVLADVEAAEETMEGSDLPAPDPTRPLDEQVAAYEARIIREAVARSGGSTAAASRLLGMGRMRLARKLRHYGIKEA